MPAILKIYKHEMKESFEITSKFHCFLPDVINLLLYDIKCLYYIIVVAILQIIDDEFILGRPTVNSSFIESRNKKYKVLYDKNGNNVLVTKFGYKCILASNFTWLMRPSFNMQCYTTQGILSYITKYQ